jgi:hypothetical protein
VKLKLFYKMFDKNGFSGSLNKFALGLRGEVEKSFFFFASATPNFLQGRVFRWSLAMALARSREKPKPAKQGLRVGCPGGS